MQTWPICCTDILFFVLCANVPHMHDLTSHILTLACLCWHGLHLPAICNYACITSKPNLKSELYPSLHFVFLYLRDLTKVFSIKLRLIFNLQLVKFEELSPSTFCTVSQILHSD